MSSQKIFPVLVACVVVLNSCAVLTRTQVTTYHVMVRDSVVLDDVHNAPGATENGVVFPTSMERRTHHEHITYDSLYTRYYPRFTRAGVFEAAGFITAGDNTNGIGGGLFGVLGMFDSTFLHSSGQSSFFTGGMYRLFTWEGSVDIDYLGECSLGTTVAEAFAKDRGTGHSLVGVAPAYLKKRFFLREGLPYVIVAPFIGVAAVPSVYCNIGASLDVGSVGGLNVRTYAGYIVGANPGYIYKSNGGILSSSAVGSVNFPYFGLGISALDFVNSPAETQREWRDEKHSATEVSLVQIIPIVTTNNGEKLRDPVLKEFGGVSLRLATVAFPLGKFVERGFSLGTSLFNVLFLSRSAGAYAVLPVRASYRRYFTENELLSATAFLEMNYYPAAFLNAGVSMNVGSFEGVNIVGLAGFASGSLSSTGFWKLPPNSFSAFYAGLGMNLGQFFLPEKSL